MKSVLFLVSIFILPVLAFSQNLDIEGKAKISEMDLDQTAPLIVVWQPDSILAVREASSLTDSLDSVVTSLQEQIIDLQILQCLKVKDIDGNIYDVIKIDSQMWMKQNLMVTKYNDGTSLHEEQNNSNWSNLTTPAYSWYLNDSIAYSKPYGAYYNYFSVADTNSLNVCPVGWHIPTDAEFTVLSDYLGGTNIAGGKMKETGTVHWTTPNAGATNESQYSAVPGGHRNSTAGNYPGFRTYGYYWSSSEFNSWSAWPRYMYYDSGDLIRVNLAKGSGINVRCIKDQ